MQAKELKELKPVLKEVGNIDSDKLCATHLITCDCPCDNND